jgi:uncharacterized protein YndB with AHSA1/START domain
VTVEARFETPIGRNVTDVFRALTAVEEYPEWLVSSGIVRIERDQQGPLRQGDHLRIAQRIAGRATMLDAEITVLEADSRFALRAHDRDGITVELEALVAPTGATSTLRWSVRLGLPLRYRFFESMAAPEVRRAAATDLERLKRRLEAVAG